MNPLQPVGVVFTVGEITGVAVGLGDGLAVRSGVAVGLGDGLAVRSRVGVNVGVAGAKIGVAVGEAGEYGTGERTASHPREVKTIRKMTQAIVTLYDRGI